MEQRRTANQQLTRCEDELLRIYRSLPDESRLCLLLFARQALGEHSATQPACNVIPIRMA